MRLLEIHGLKQGLNIIKIRVISQDKTTEKIYEIKVTKTANFESANTNLEILAIENYLLYPSFDNSVTQYTIEVSSETVNLNVFAVPENEQGSVTISGNENLKEGNNIITVTVTAPNGISKREYKINAYKRSLEEEQKYKQEQEEQKEKLEEAYEIEKTSTDNEEISVVEDESKENKYVVVIGICAGIIVIIVIGVILYKKGYFNKK